MTDPRQPDDEFGSAPGPGAAGPPAESAFSAREDSLADSLGIDDAADDRDAGDTSLPVSPPAPPRPPRAVPHEVDMSRFDAASSGQPPPPPAPNPFGTPNPVPDTGVMPQQGETGRRFRRRGPRSRRRSNKAPWWELPVLVIFAVLIAILLKSYVVQPFFIPSASMERTLHGCPGCQGDRILVNKVIYDLRDPHPGDIVVFHAPPGWSEGQPTTPPSNPVLKAIRGFGQLVGFVPPDGLVLVKRVIAVGGQTVKGDSHGNVFISTTGPKGPFTEINQSTFLDVDPGQTDSVRSFGPVTVPRGRLWVMGDHRNDSQDSRYHCGPDGTDGPTDATCNVVSATVPDGEVIGKAFVIAWPPSRWRTLGTPKGFTHESAAATASADLQAGTIPVVGATGLVVPFYLVRRRRRSPAA